MEILIKPGDGTGLYMIYDGENQNNFIVIDLLTCDHISYIIARCEEDKQKMIQDCLEYWLRVVRLVYEDSLPNEEDYIPKNMINNPDSTLRYLLKKANLTLEEMYEQWRSV